MTKNRKNLLILLALTLTSTSAILLGTAARLISAHNAPVRFDNAYIANELPKDKNYPVLIEFHALQLKLPISPANITAGKWDDPKHTVAYWINSPIPGDHGNSVMYGHKWPTILGKLPKSQINDIISIVYSDGQHRDFEVSATYVVTADQKHILNPSDDARLTIYTCTGFLDSKRFVVVAVPV